MTITRRDTDEMRALQGLEDSQSSVRLRAALAVGATPDPRFVDKLVERCAIEPEFFVRDMLTWALTRHPVSKTLPELLGEVRSDRAQARSQALHTLSKIGDRQAWPAITRALLSDADDEVARSAWRAAVVLVPRGEESALAEVLATQLGRGERETQLSLSRALIALGEVILPALRAPTKAPDPRVRAHALATRRLLRDPDAGFEFAIEEAKRVLVLGGSGQEGRQEVLIGEVARRSGVSARMLRHYESLGLVRPSGRTGSGYREYSGDDIRRIFHIESLRSLGLSLREIGRALDDPGFAPSALVDDLIRQTRERLAAETELLTRLRRIGAAEPADWEDVLQAAALLQALGSKCADARERAALSSVDEGLVPVEALVEAALSETDPNVAGALRWALARSGDGGSALLAEGLGSPDAAVRERAVQSLAEMPGDEATALLHGALANPDVAVRGYAAVALGIRGVPDAVPTLIDVIVEGGNDTDAADALSVLARDTATADRIATRLVDRLAHHTTEAPARGRLTQSLADIPGPTASGALMELSHDRDRVIALTAVYLLRLRDAR